MAHGCWIALLAGAVALAQENPTRKAAEYPVHATTAAFDIGAEYMVHSIPAEDGEIFTNDYLVVEVAIYPTHGPVTMSAERFTLRLNGKKSVLYAQSPGMVAASLKYPDWEGVQPRLTGDVGIGDGQIVVNGTPQVGRFPGDPADRRVPRPTTDPPKTDEAPPPKSEAMSIDEKIARAALPEGQLRTPKKGALFFPFKGKTKSIHSVELLYEDEVGNKVALKLLQ